MTEPGDGSGSGHWAQTHFVGGDMRSDGTWDLHT
jgi:hypothetical protein